MMKDIRRSCRCYTGDQMPIIAENCRFLPCLGGVMKEQLKIARQLKKGYLKGETWVLVQMPDGSQKEMTVQEWHKQYRSCAWIRITRGHDPTMNDLDCLLSQGYEAATEER